ncbi:MAG TPA: CGNR zinc finger domain-containing protein [Trueperaceae bacterium]|nr:CGNR zinc finger domain-containing protein [Trueperaceae bacterium]
MRAAERLGKESKPAPGDLRFVQAFVNTLDVESGRDRFAEVSELQSWLHTHCELDASIRLTEKHRQEAVEFREALRTVMTEGSESDPAALAVLEDVGRRADLRLSTTKDGRLNLDASGTDPCSALGRLLAAVHTAMLDGTWSRLKVCAADECRWAFYDASKNRSGTWCSMEVCGNRSKVREHRSRQRPAQA